MGGTQVTAHKRSCDLGAIACELLDHRRLPDHQRLFDPQRWRPTVVVGGCDVGCQQCSQLGSCLIGVVCTDPAAYADHVLVVRSAGERHAPLNPHAWRDTARQRSVSCVIRLNGSKPQLSLLLAYIVLDAGLQSACSLVIAYPRQGFRVLSITTR